MAIKREVSMAPKFTVACEARPVRRAPNVLGVSCGGLHVPRAARRDGRRDQRDPPAEAICGRRDAVTLGTR